MAKLELNPIKDEICKQIDELAREPLSEQKPMLGIVEIDDLDRAHFYGYEQAKLASAELVCELFNTRQPDPKSGSIEQSELDVLKQRCETSEGDIHLPFVLKVIARLEQLERQPEDKCETCYGISCPHWLQCYPNLVTDIKELEGKNKELQQSGIELMVKVSKLEAKLEQAEEQIEGYAKLLGSANNDVERLSKYADELEVERDKAGAEKIKWFGKAVALVNEGGSLKEALGKYGQHYSWCGTQKIGQTTYICNCGLEKAQKGGN